MSETSIDEEKKYPAGSLISFDCIAAHAQSDAEFDGKEWSRLDSAERERYFARAVAGYEAAAKVHFSDLMKGR